jgi:hypothetical protein
MFRSYVSPKISIQCRNFNRETFLTQILGISFDCDVSQLTTDLNYLCGSSFSEKEVNYILTELRAKLGTLNKLDVDTDFICEVITNRSIHAPKDDSTYIAIRELNLNRNTIGVYNYKCVDGVVYAPDSDDIHPKYIFTALYLNLSYESLSYSGKTHKLGVDRYDLEFDTPHNLKSVVSYVDLLNEKITPVQPKGNLPKARASHSTVESVKHTSSDSMSSIVKSLSQLSAIVNVLVDRLLQNKILSDNDLRTTSPAFSSA